MKQIVSNYSYSPTTNVVTLTGVNIDADQLLLIVAPQVGRTMYNFASVTGAVSAGADTRVTLNASTVGLTTTSPLVIFYDDQLSTQTIAGTVNVGNSVTIGSLPAISGTVTVGNTVTIAGTVAVNAGSAINWNTIRLSNYSGSGAVALNGIYKKTENVGYVDGGGSGTPIYEPIDGNTWGPLPISFRYAAALAGEYTGNRWSLISDNENRFWATTTASNITSVTGWLNSSGAVTATVANFSALPVALTNEIAVNSLPAISGTVTVGNSVTIGSLPTLTPQLPRVTFIDGSGTVTTANSAITVFASSSTRSYLLVQVTTGSAFVNVGATATTVNGISLTAGQGYAWETTIPQGAVSLISTTTNSAYVAKQA